MRFIILGLSTLLFCACSKSGAPAPQSKEPAAASTRLLVWNLHDYAWRDRDQGGQPDDPKPENERHAIQQVLQDQQPKMILLRGLGSSNSVEMLRAETGENWQATVLPEAGNFQSSAFLSQEVPERVRSHTDLSYKTGGTSWQTRVHEIRIDGLQLWLARISAPDERSYEARRNEARIIAKRIKDRREDGLPQLLFLSMEDPLNSPMARYFRDAGLYQLPAEDAQGDHWTHHAQANGIYRSLLTVWFSNEAFPGDLHIPDSPAVRTVGPHRPVVWRDAD